jgi:hypothetical protein
MYTIDLRRPHQYGELWCYTSSQRVGYMIRGAKRKEKPIQAESSSVRATISFPPETYKTLEDIARQKKVSLAWVVREATERYIAEKWPLFHS